MTRTRSTSTAHLATVTGVVLASAVLAAVPAASSAAAPAGSAPAGGLSPELRAATGPVRVTVYTTGGRSQAPPAWVQDGLGRRMSMAIVRRHQARGDTAGLLALRSANLHRALAWADAATARATATLKPMVRWVESQGATVVTLDAANGSLTVRVPATALRRIAAHRRVRSVQPAPKPENQADPAPTLTPLFPASSLANTQIATGAPSVWAAGHLGGEGSADQRDVNIDLHESFAVESRHPTFAGLRFQRPSGTPRSPGCSAGACRHATAVASVMVGRGARDCPTCTPSDADQKGTAPGIGSLMESTFVPDLAPKHVPFDPFTWAAGIDQPRADDPSIVLPGAEDPADVANVSIGIDPEGYDDHPYLWAFDRGVELHGIVTVASAGNTGRRYIIAPGIAYNAITVGGVATLNASRPDDDVVHPVSSFGPTPAGRKKPDIVAPADTWVAEPRWEDPQVNRLWDITQGTSFSSATVSGASALLIGAGVTDPLAVKAVLVNSARPGRLTKQQPMGTQTTWQPEWGWGELDVRTAYGQRTFWSSGKVQADAPRFYRAVTTAPGERATLVWQRRGTGCGWITCRNGNYALTNLDLTSYDAGGAPSATSASTIDNVEQLRVPSPGVTVLKVKANSKIVSAPTGEPFAISGTGALQAITGPSLAVAPSTGPAAAGSPAIVTATVRNVGDLAAPATATLKLPAGISFAAGSPAATQSAGTLQPGGEATVSWRVVAAESGTRALTVSGTATAFGESLATASRVDLTTSAP